MEYAFEEASVTGYECLVWAMTKDPKERHDLAAAVCRGAQAVITHNEEHFRPESAKPSDGDIQTPGDFVVHQCYFNDEQPKEKLVAQATARGIGSDALLDRLHWHASNWMKSLR